MSVIKDKKFPTEDEQIEAIEKTFYKLECDQFLKHVYKQKTYVLSLLIVRIHYKNIIVLRVFRHARFLNSHKINFFISFFL